MICPHPPFNSSTHPQLQDLILTSSPEALTGSLQTHSKDSVLASDAGLNQGLTGSSWFACVHACVRALLRYYSLVCMGHSGVTLPFSISTQPAHTPIILALAGFLIAQEETWFILPVHSPCQVYAVYTTKCHQTSVAEELGIVLNERHV